MRLPKKIPRGATLRLEFVKCGRCPNQHGPYWYAYWKDYRGVTRKLYLGKQLPDHTTGKDPLDTSVNSRSQ